MKTESEEATTTPVVSVIIPAYKAAEHIGKALDSVFSQTFSDYEVIVVNDGSPDTALFEQALQPYLRRIHYISQPNRGPSSARNIAIMNAVGEYVAFLDSDDTWLPEYLEEQIRLLHNEPALDLVFSDALLIGDSHLSGQTFMQSVAMRGPVTWESLIKWECSVLTSTVVARRRSLVAAGLFDQNFRRSEDFDLWLRLLRMGGNIKYHRRVLARRNMGGESLSADRSKMIEGQIEVYRKHVTDSTLPPELAGLLALQITKCEAFLDLEEGKAHFVAGSYEKAAVVLSRGNAVFRSMKVRLAILGLRLVPRLLRWGYLWRQRLLSGKST
jgi:glycosyltransferase involved in cell wall biosynthesis